MILVSWYVSDSRHVYRVLGELFDDEEAELAQVKFDELADNPNCVNPSMTDFEEVVSK